MNSIQFPEGFWWGAAMSAPQFEGAPIKHFQVIPQTHNKRNDIWQYWFGSDKKNDFNNQVGPEDFEGFNQHWESDIDLMHQLGFNSMRLSISWSRFMPDGKNTSEEAVAFYRAVLSKMNNLGIKPVVNLYHFDLPQWLYAFGGWENPLVVQKFKSYAECAFTVLGDLVTHWTTFNEPLVPIEMGYLNQYQLPAVYSTDRAAKVIEYTALAHLEAVQSFNLLKSTRVLTPGHKIGIIVNLSPVYPATQAPEDLVAAAYADAFYNQLFLSVAMDGVYPQKLLEMFPVEPKSLKEKEGSMLPVDFLGVNYYHPRRVRAGDGITPISQGLEGYFQTYQWAGAKVNPHRGWEIYPQGLGDLALRLQEDYPGLPWYVAENGMGIPRDREGFSDFERIDFIKAHLKVLHGAIKNGCQCFGYHHWTFIDNWSWLNAFKNRYGLVGLDLATGERYFKSSGRWFETVSRANGWLEIDQD